MQLNSTSLTTALILLFTLSTLSVNAQNQKSTDRIAVTAKRMIDIRSGKEISDVVILIEKK